MNDESASTEECKKDEEKEDLVCPICLSTDHEVSDAVEFCQSPCGHIFCVPCLEHFLLKPKSNDDHGQVFGTMDNEDDYYHRRRPNTGSCPLCRQTINLFGLINIQDRSPIYTKNSVIKTWPICDKRYSKQSIRRSLPSTEERLLNRLMEDEGVMSGYGLEFDFSSSNPGIRVTAAGMLVTSDDQGSCSNDQNTKQVEFQPWNTFHFFAKTMTFQGNIQFPSFVTRPSSRDYRYDQLECLLQFSENGHFVRDGYLRWKLQSTKEEEQQQEEEEAASTIAEASTLEHFPLDGTWQVLWRSGQSIKIHIQRHCFDCFQQWYEIELDDNHCPRFPWPSEFGQDVVQRSNQSLPPGHQGPAIGETFEWATNSAMPAYSTIVWKRLGTDLSDAWKLIRLKPNHFAFKRVMVDGESGGDDDSALIARPSYHSDRLWGNTFCQAFCVGLASYHFLGPNSETGALEAYISYEHPQTSSWPPLDNGSAVPSRVPFRNISYDSETRTFRGDICWLEVYGTRWQGEAKWSYEIKFDPLFLFVEGGTCEMTEGRPDHQFGVDLVYVNAAIEDPLGESIRTNDSNTNYESASEMTKGMIGHLIRNLVQNPESSVFDFNL
ncbi:unnamed protein product [Cylindrotheca closterium]|uniref:RING-type domain-containing protein n=1 Tax=Cylindrotheca closterium TaxID=2856 RepID=A0AAD2FMI7_9STRA|nr:unnamed protein product [Cylindrotheca closterium]